MEIIERPLESLKDYAGNARTHSDIQIVQIMDSIKQFGFLDPIEVDSNLVILSGHARVEAARRAGLSLIPTVMHSHLNEVDKKGYILAANRIAASAGWDDDILRDELSELESEGFDLALTGFTDDEIAELLTKDLVDVGQTEDDDLPSDSPSRVQCGDVWICGEHRVMCGDSTHVEDVARLMRETSDAFCFTSPPYYDARDYEGELDLTVPHIASFIRASMEHCNLYAVNLGIIRKEHAVVTYWNDYIAEAQGCGFKLISWNVWDKGEAGSIGNQTAPFAISHEFIFVFGETRIELNRTVPNSWAGETANHTGHRQKDGKIKKSKSRVIQSHSQLKTVISVSAQKARDDIDHPARFPVELPEQYILACTKKGDIIYDPFGGSGSTLIAAEKTGRKCYMMEISASYAGMCISRWEQYVGRKARLEAKG